MATMATDRANLHGSVQTWSPQERRQVVAAGIAPLVVSLALAGIAFMSVGSEAILLLVALLPLSYATLFFFVLPSLWVLRRFRWETLIPFPLVCWLSTFVPWSVLYLLLFPEGTGKYSGEPIHVLTLLALPALFSAVAGVVVYRVGAPAANSKAT
jgi:hypothetical protein